MKNRNKLKSISAKLVLVCFLYMLSSPLISAVKIPKIVWRKVPGARFYQVEIRNSYKRLVLRRRTSSTTFKYKLPYGKYQIRISAFNRAGQMGSKSPWIGIQIKKPIQPGIRSVKVKKSTRKRAKVEVSGKNFVKGASVYIKKEDNKVEKIKNYKLKNGKITFSVNKKELKKNFKVVVKNPGDLKSEKSPFESSKKPEIENITAKNSASNPNKKQITITGSNFKAGSIVFVKKGNQLIPVQVSKQTDSQITFSLDKTQAQGKLQIIVKNPGTDSKTITQKHLILAKESKKPVIDSISTKDSASAPNKKQITITGSNFKAGSIVFVKKGNQLIPVQVSKQTDSQITFSLDKTQAQGKIQIIVKNPGADSKKENQSQKVIVIKGKNTPTILSYEIKQGITYPNISYITITGKNFKRNLSTVSLSNKDKKLKIMRVRILNTKTIRFSAFTKDLVDGLFKLKVSNKESFDYRIFARGNAVPDIRSYVLKRKEQDPELTSIKAEALNVEANAKVSLYNEGKKIPIKSLKQNNSKFSFEVDSDLLSPGLVKLLIQNKSNDLKTERTFRISESYFKKPKVSSALKMQSFGIYGYTKLSPETKQGVGVKTTIGGKYVEVPINAYSIGDKYRIKVIPKYFLFTKENNLFISFLSEVKKENLQIGAGIGSQGKGYSAGLWFTYYPYYWEEDESKRIGGLETRFNLKQGRWRFLLDFAFGLSKVDYNIDSTSTKSSAVYFDTELEIAFRIYSSLFLSAGIKTSYENSSALLKSDAQNSAFDNKMNVILIYGIRYEF